MEVSKLLDRKHCINLRVDHALSVTTSWFYLGIGEAFWIDISPNARKGDLGNDDHMESETNVLCKITSTFEKAVGPRKVGY